MAEKQWRLVKKRVEILSFLYNWNKSLAGSRMLAATLEEGTVKRFLMERSSELHQKYRARIAEIKAAHLKDVMDDPKSQARKIEMRAGGIPFSAGLVGLDDLEKLREVWEEITEMSVMRTQNLKIARIAFLDAKTVVESKQSPKAESTPSSSSTDTKDEV
ncbi:MAG: hypothetical protein LBJ61_02785 [Deltaproteobacteria bacterium]|jgi:single-stranded DNA-specific DHH superfamily exonuclease|nr:hypothetical protein [Deltaproteobacteria bacterium]